MNKKITSELSILIPAMSPSKKSGWDMGSSFIGRDREQTNKLIKIKCNIILYILMFYTKKYEKHYFYSNYFKHLFNSQ